jgi:hypothetical protein
MPETPIIRGRTSSQRDSGQSAGTLPALRVRYYKRMRPNKVYPVQVGWRSGRKGGDGGPVQVRLIMAGAQVVPSEQTMDPTDPDAKVTFYVTPLARGWLRGERIEVVQNGRKVGELRTGAKVTTQRFTWVMLALTLLVPWLLHQFFTHKLEEEVKIEYQTRNQLPLRLQKQVRDAEAVEAEKEAKEGKVEEVKDKDGKRPAAEVKKQKIQDGEVLEHQIRTVLPDVLPQVNERVEREHTAYVTEIPEKIGLGYTVVFQTYKSYSIPYYAFWILLVLTLLSYLWHREKRKTRVGTPIELGD